MKNLVLYYKPTCPFSLKVLRYLKENNIELEMRDINSEPGAVEELISTGGKKQVPCMFIDGNPMYESDDIISYLKENRG